MKKKYSVGMAAMTCLSGAVMVTAASYAMFTADTQTPIGYMKAGTLQITSTVEDAAACESTFNSSAMPRSNLNLDFTPGAGKTGELLVHNTGTLTAWVGLINDLSDPGRYVVSYTVQVYQSDPFTTDASDPDANGDLYRMCHSHASMETGAFTHVSKTVVVPGDPRSHTPFRLPVGDYALVTYQFSQSPRPQPVVPQPTDKLNDPATLSVSIEAVQYRNSAESSRS